MSSSQNAKTGTSQSRVVTTARNIKAAITQNFKAVTTQSKAVITQNKAAPAQNNNTAGTSQNKNAAVATQNSAAVTNQNNNAAVATQNSAAVTNQNNSAAVASQNNAAVTNQTNNTSGTSQNNNAALTSQNNNTVTSQINNHSGTVPNTKGVSALITSTTAQVTSNTTAQNMNDSDKAKAEKRGPSKLQLEKWTSSINSLLSDPDGVKYFRQFLEDKEPDDGKGELTKYVDFYVECEQYKSEFKILEEKALKIYEKYLAVGADQELPAGDGCADIGDKLDEEGLEGVTLFDEPQKIIKKTIADDLYVDFCLNIKEKLKL